MEVDEVNCEPTIELVCVLTEETEEEDNLEV